jgi:hypothetical protein
MKVEIGAEAALFPEKEYINGIAVAVQRRDSLYAFRKQNAGKLCLSGPGKYFETLNSLII